MSKEIYSKNELKKFRDVQKLAYDCVTEIRDHLKVGMTEKQAAKMIDTWLRKKGVRNFFHMGFAWFGDRTRFKNFNKPLQFSTSFIPIPHFGFEFLPSNRRLKKGMPVILDVGPSMNGIAADIGYSFAFGSNPKINKAIMDLKKFRSLILRMARQKKTMKEIYQATDKLLTGMGYESCHGIYPLGVLGHKVGKVPLTFLPRVRVMGFHTQTFIYLLRHAVKKLWNQKKNKTPFWTHDANVPLEPGLWAVEPHIGKGNIGVKFEELLVVTSRDAYWLDDDLPHVNFWKQNARKVKKTSTK